MEFFGYQPSSFAPIEASNLAGTYPSGGPEWQQQQQQQYSQQSQQLYFSTPGETGLEESMWRMSLRQQDFVGNVYPERPGEPDCAYYMRTGICGFGASCKFNHPPRQQSASTLSRGEAEYPQRVGQPDCQYYLKTGTCKFGSTCKYHHPIEKPAITAQLNALNLPIRPGEKDCAFYMRTGNCKYGSTCKFNHPQPMMPLTGAIPGPTGAVPGTSLYLGAVPGWAVARSPYLSSSHISGPSGFPPVILPSPQGVVPVPAWNPYQAPLPVQEGTIPAGYIYGTALPLQESGVVDVVSPLMPGPSSIQLPMPPSSSMSGVRQGVVYPERPGQLDCQYYMKTGECRFGMQCKFHHPPNRNITHQASVLSPMGLPLRPGVPPCTFYTRFGFCKFGPTCKFDHPFVPTVYSPVLSGSSLHHIYSPPLSGIPMEHTSSRQDNTGGMLTTQQSETHGSS